MGGQNGATFFTDLMYTTPSQDVSLQQFVWKRPNVAIVYVLIIIDCNPSQL
jgi:hypothetical protein